MKVSNEQRAEWQAEQERYEAMKVFQAEAEEQVHNLIDRYIALKMHIVEFEKTFKKTPDNFSFAAVRDAVQYLADAASRVATATHRLVYYVDDGRTWTRYRDVVVLGGWREDKGRAE